MRAAEFSDLEPTGKQPSSPQFPLSSEHSLCSEVDFRNALNDDDFWDYVFNRASRTEDLHHPWWEEGSDRDLYDDDLVIPTDYCPICGSVGACGTDSEGRPMIHCLPVDTEA